MRRQTVVVLVAAIAAVVLIVVVGGGVLLLAARRAGAAKQKVECKANLRDLMQAHLMFANEHKMHLPGGALDHKNPDPEKRDWLLASSDWSSGPEGGTVFRYTGSNAAVYRCPGASPGTRHGGVGSNGRYDYAVCASLAGAKVTKVRLNARYTRPDGRVEELPTPVIVEQDPAAHLNAAAGRIDGSHAGDDRMARRHRGHRGPEGPVGNYASIDGSVHDFSEPPGGDATRWSSPAASGNWTSLGTPAEWGWWNKQ